MQERKKYLRVRGRIWKEKETMKKMERLKGIKRQRKRNR